MFSKRLDELDATDIRRVVNEQRQEGPELEFKKSLPARKNGGLDPWITNQDSVGDYARNQIIEEVIAFANTYGGILIIGIDETVEKPPRAAEICALPKCADLAERLRLQCRDCIEPEIPQLQVTGVRTNDDDSGVVVFHVPRSRAGPHRHTITRECYSRHADRSEKMIMRDIQTLTLNLARGLEAIDQKLLARQAGGDKTFGALKGGSRRAYSIRTTAVPVDAIFIDRVHKNEALPLQFRKFVATSAGKPLTIELPTSFLEPRPILRGTRGHFDLSDRFHLFMEVYCDGLVEYFFVHKKLEGDTPYYIQPNYVIGTVVNTLCVTERFRRAAGAPSIEYAMELEIWNMGDSLNVSGYKRTGYEDFLGPLAVGRTTFPRYSVGHPDGFQELTELIERDFWHSVGHVCQDEEILQINYSDLLA